MDTSNAIQAKDLAEQYLAMRAAGMLSGIPIDPEIQPEDTDLQPQPVINPYGRMGPAPTVGYEPGNMVGASVNPAL